MIEFRDVHASYDGERAVLKGVDFTIGDGEFVSFVVPMVRASLQRCA